MIQLITGKPGEGKTKQLIEAANNSVSTLKGHAIYIDSTQNHRLALSHHIRLIEASTFPLHSSNDFLGFLCGILATNHDIEIIYIDELIKLTRASIDELTYLFSKIKKLSETYNVGFVIGASFSIHDLPESLTPYLIA